MSWIQNPNFVGGFASPISWLTGIDRKYSGRTLTSPVMLSKKYL